MATNRDREGERRSLISSISHPVVSANKREREEVGYAQMTSIFVPPPALSAKTWKLSYTGSLLLCKLVVEDTTLGGSAFSEDVLNESSLMTRELSEGEMNASQIERPFEMRIWDG